MFTKHQVIIHDYAKRHFIKSFEKKYSNKWEITLKAIIFELENPEAIIGTNFFEKIHVHKEYYIAKGEFKIAGTKESKNSSGCRYIVKIDTRNNLSELLLIYHKNDIKMNNETVWWEKQIEGLQK